MFELEIGIAAICLGVTFYLAEKYKIDGDGGGPCCAG